MTYLFFDTETTGLPDFKRPPTWEGQPRICQLGAILTDADGKVKGELNVLVKPDGWVIPEAASAIHGIAQEDALRYGLSIRGVLSIFDRMLRSAEVVVAHNIRFDLLMLEIESHKAGVGIMLPGQTACTMSDSADVLKTPPTARMLAYEIKGYKNPNLQEAYHHFFGVNFKGAHDAMADVRACKDVFFALQKLKVAA